MSVAPGIVTAGGARGFTVLELLVALVVSVIVCTMAVALSIAFIGREENRSAISVLRVQLQTAKIQAVSRNRACRFLVNTATRKVQITDLNDPANSSDDLVLEETTLSSKLQFAEPSGGLAVTLSLLSGTTYQATFAPDGSVTSGAGSISLFAGERYNRITIYAAGGTKFERWEGGSWIQGS